MSPLQVELCIKLTVGTHCDTYDLNYGETVSTKTLLNEFKRHIRGKTLTELIEAGCKSCILCST